MRNNVLYIILCSLIISLIVLLIIDKEEPITIYTVDNVYSIKHTDQTESFSIRLLVSSVDSYMFQKTYISSIGLESKDDELSLILQDIQYTQNVKEMNGKPYHLVDLICKIPLESNNMILSLEDASVSISYENGKNYAFIIGDFNYIFSTNQNDINLSNLSATYQEINGINTVGGVNLSLTNNSFQNIQITDINIISNKVDLNFGESFVMEPCEHTKTVNECLVVDGYDFHHMKESSISYSLRKNTTIDLYIPMFYDEQPFAHRFSIEVVYLDNVSQKSFIIDDFPFMSTNIFYDGLEDDYHEYIITSSN